METEKTYNGWANWATWNINLWVDNDEETYKKKERLIDRAIDRVVSGLTADQAKDIAVELFPVGTPDMGVADIDWTKDVDWEELAIHWEER